jgi:hypothetical protein
VIKVFLFSATISSGSAADALDCFNEMFGRSRTFQFHFLPFSSARSTRTNCHAKSPAAAEKLNRCQNYRIQTMVSKIGPCLWVADES